MSSPNKEKNSKPGGEFKNDSQHSRLPSKLELSPSKETLGEEQYEAQISSLTSFDKEVIEYIQKADSTAFEVYPGAERLEYDFAAERRNMFSTNLYESTAHMIKGCLGAGILGIHEAYMYGGLWTAFGATFLIGFITSSSMLMVVNSAQKMYVRLRIPRLSYPDLAEVAVATGPLICCRRFSKIFRYTIDSFLLLQQISTCCIYQIMIATTLKQVMEVLSPEVKKWHLSFSMYILITMTPLLLLCVIRNFKYLAPLSFIADIFIGFCLFICVFYSIKAAGNIRDIPGWKSAYGLYRFSGVCVYSIDGISLVMPIENNMKSPKYFRTILVYAMVIVVTAVACVGFFGYWGWAENCRSPITLHIPMTTVLIFFQFLLIVMLSVTFALHFWVPFRIFWRYVMKRFKKRRGHWERFFRIMNVIIITGLAIAFPNLNKVMSFLGNILISCVTFIFPAFIESLVTWKEKRRGWIRWVLIKNVIFIMFGASLWSGGVYANLPFE